MVNKFTPLVLSQPNLHVRSDCFMLDLLLHSFCYILYVIYEPYELYFLLPSQYMRHFMLLLIRKYDKYQKSLSNCSSK